MTERKVYVDTNAGMVKGIESKATTSNPKDLLGAQKVSITKLPFIAIAHGAHAMMDGAGKYGPYNWRDKSVISSIYVDAAFRHLGDWFEGQETANDSGVHHLGHAIACCAILLDAQENGNLIDDRPVGGNPNVSAEVLDRLSKVIKEQKLKKDVVYLAGIVDGEGNISIIRRESQRREAYSVRLSVYNTDIKLIEFLRSRFGGTVVKRKPRKKEHSTSFIISWNHKQAIDLITSIHPYLLVKKEQADTVLEFQKLVHKPGKNGYSESVLVKMREAKKRVNELNKKGEICESV